MRSLHELIWLGTYYEWGNRVLQFDPKGVREYYQYGMRGGLIAIRCSLTGWILLLSCAACGLRCNVFWFSYLKSRGYFTISYSSLWYGYPGGPRSGMLANSNVEIGFCYLNRGLTLNWWSFVALVCSIWALGPSVVLGLGYLWLWLYKLQILLDQSDCSIRCNKSMFVPGWLDGG